jgi:hypothetical protein
MSRYQPGKDKNGGLPTDISYIKRKPEPLETEFKTSCDANMGVMIWAASQEGQKGMLEKEHNLGLGTTCATVVRGME